MFHLCKGVLLSTLLLFFVFAHSQYSRAAGQTLFHVLNVTAFFLATVLNAGRIEFAQAMRIFPLSLLDYLYLVAQFREFLTASLVQIPIDIIFTHVCLIFVSETLTFTRMAIFCILLFCYNLYQSILEPVRPEPSELGTSILTTLLFFRAGTVLFHKNTLCPERHLALFMIAAFDAAIGYQTVRREILCLSGDAPGGPSTLHVLGFTSYIVLIVLLSFVRTLSVSCMVVFAVQSIVLYLGLLVVDYTHFPVWNFGMYSVFPKLTVLLAFIAVQLLCLGALDVRKEEPVERLDTVEDIPAEAAEPLQVESL